MTNDKNKGFTLIELLAVIVILAVIALIAVPRIIEILNKSRLSAAEDSTMGIVEAVESYIANFMLQNQGAISSENLEFSCNSSEGCKLITELEGYDTKNLDKLNYKGKKVSSGTITISNGGKSIQATNLNINGYTCNYLNDEAYCGKKEYNSGDEYQLGDYKWHVISDDGKYLTLLMDVGQLGEHNTMAHCTNDFLEDTDCGYYVDYEGNKYVSYSWDKSLIREYLNGEFLINLEQKIGINKLMTFDICADGSYQTVSYSYGGYLKSEIDSLGIMCNSGYVNDKVRLITDSEYYNLSPIYNNISLPYEANLANSDQIGKIAKIDSIMRVTSTDWLYSSNIGGWWTMTPHVHSSIFYRQNSHFINKEGKLDNYHSFNESYVVRPVIKLLK